MYQHLSVLILIAYAQCEVCSSMDDEGPGWSVPTGRCIECNRKTRSHVIEPPEYNKYLQEVIVAQSDDFASKKWEEVDEVEKWERVKEAVVMCHACWLGKRDETFSQLEKKCDEWVENPLPNMQRLKSFLTKWEKFGFCDNMGDNERKNRIIEERH